MIYKMKKLSLVVYYKDKVDLLDKLTSLGVVHPNNKSSVVHKDIEDINEKKENYLKALKTVNDYKSLLAKQKRTTDLKGSFVSSDLSKYIDAISQASSNVDKLKSEKDSLAKMKISALPFGQFDVEKLKEIESSTGYKVLFYFTSKKDYDNYDFGDILNLLVSDEKRVYFVVFKKDGEELDLPFESVSMPDLSLSDLDKKIAELEEAIVKAEDEVASYENVVPMIKDYLAVLGEDIHYLTARESFVDCEETEGTIETIDAFIPLEKEAEVVDYLEKNNVVYSIEDPNYEDRVPVKLKNNGYSGAYKLITNLFQLPDYYEIDPTPMIAVFYPIFFAYCFGDTGYGLMIIAATLIATITVLKKKNMLNIAVIGFTLGIFTTIMGVINSGVVFGLDMYGSGIPILEKLSEFTFIRDARGGETYYLLTPFNTALICGLIQIFVALIINVMNKIRYGVIGDTLGAVGKLILIPSLVLWFLGDMRGIETINNMFSPFYYIGIVVGVVFLSLLSNVGKKFSVLDSILSIYFAITGLLGDVLSYIRLFALGASSAILGLVVNQIAMTLGGSIAGVGVVIMVVFLVVGHVGNFALSILGSLVHPLRLTFVEYYNNSGFKGGGVVYKPLKKTSMDNVSN